MAENETTTRFRVDISELQAGITQANRQIRLANSEFRAATDCMDDWSQSADGISANLTRLNNVLGSQRTVLSNLERQYQLTVDEMGEGSTAAQNLQIQINNQRAAIARTERDISNYSEQLENLGNDANEAGEDLENLGNDADGLSSKLGDLAKKGFAAVATAAAGVVTAFLGSAEATREYREDIGKLQTAFETAGQPAETATEMYKGFFSVLGEEDRSIEAVNHLAKLTTNQEELAQWTDICAGVWGTFGDSLPIEGLTEASNETAKTGQLTGVLADALNWAGVAEDDFQASLDACNTEQERATLITETLNGLYSEAAENYKENNGAIMEAQRAQSELTDAMAAVGAVAEPVMTSLKLLGAEMLTGILPAVETLGEAFNGLLNGESGSGEAIGEAIGDVVNFAIDKITTMLPQVLSAGVSLIMSLAQGVIQAVPQLLSAILGMLPDIIATLGEMIPKLIDEVLRGIYLIIDEIILAAPELLTAAIQFFTTIVEALPTIVENLMEQIDTLVIDIIYGLIDAIPDLLNAAMEFFGAIVEAIPQIIESIATWVPSIVTSIVDFLVEGVPQLLDGAITLLMAIVDAIPEIITALTDALPEVIDALITGLLDAIPELLDASIEFLMAIIEAIPIIIDKLVPVIPDIITTIVEILIDNIPIILEASVQLFMAIVEAIPEIIVELSKTVPEIVTSILEGLSNLSDSLAELLGNAFNRFVEWGSNLISKGAEVASNLFDVIVEKIKGLPNEMLGLGKNIVEGLWNGINDMADWIGTKIKGFGDGVLDGIKDFFGIASPSKVLRKEVGRYLPEGLALGISDTAKKAINAAKDMSNGIKSTVSGINDGLSFGGSAGINAGSSAAAVTSNSYNFYQTNNSPKALSRIEIYRQTKNQLNFARGV